MVRVLRARKQSSNTLVMATMMTVEKGHGLDLLGYCALTQQALSLRQSQGGIDSFDQNGPIVAPSTSGAPHGRAKSELETAY